MSPKAVLRIVALAVSATAIFFAVSGTLRASGTFSPTVSLELSTTRATSHPDARITIDNTNSSDNIKSVTLHLPTGLWGSLAAADKCAYATAQANGCTSANQIGTVDASATIDQSDSRLRGKVYLTTPAPANAATDPAGITVVVPAVVGNVDLGDVIVNARAMIRTAALPPTAATGAVGAIEGVDTTVDTVPQSITDTHGRTVAFHLDKMMIDLSSDLDGPKPPLLTNPSTCGSISVTGNFTSYADALVTATDPTPETVSGCNTVKYGPSAFTMVKSNKAAGAETILSSTITFPADSATTKFVQVKLPPGAAPNFPSFGTSADQCPASVFSLAAFNPATCPAQAKVGTATITTPLLPDPVIGNVYLVNKSPVPNLAIWVSPTTDAGNPKGVDIRLLGSTTTPQIDPTCDPGVDVCPTQIVAAFNNIPDAPVSSIDLTIGQNTTRTGVGPTTLSGKVLVNATASDPACQAKDEFTGLFRSNAVVSAAQLESYGVSTDTMTGCNSRLVNFTDTTTLGNVVSTPSPSIALSGSAVSCFFDSGASPLGDCTSPISPAAPLNKGIHRVFATGSDSLVDSRAFAYAPTSSAPDTTAPVTSITSPPSTVSTVSPTFDFTSDESATFQCAINPGSSITTAYLPCGSASASTSGSYDVANLFSGLTYTFGVRAQDAAGNVDLTPATTTFSVDIPFNPVFTTDVSTLVARAHPDFDVTVTNGSHEDIKDFTFSLPDGFFGGLTGVASLCPLANADAGTCPSSSQVGTVDAEAAVDESTIRNSGTVYLTESRDPATEPASLSIKLHPAIQDVVFDDIIVNAHLKVRGVAQGIDTFALDLPNSATNAIDGTTEFDLRKMTIKLRTGVGAPHPLLTNPSDCRAMSFDATYKGYDDTETSYSQPFQVTGCAALPFAPGMALNAVDQDTGQIAGPSTNLKRVALRVNASLTSDESQAGIKSVVLTMPRPITIDVLKLPTPCSLEQAAAKACPQTAAIGEATAVSPLLNEPISGTVYMLKSTTTLPRLLIALRGRINVDIIGENSFFNGNQIVTTFNVLPDVPLTTFTIGITTLLTTRNDACNSPISAWNVTGTLTGFNGSASNVVLPQKFNCPEAYGPIAHYSLKKSGKKSTLTADVKSQTEKKIKKKLTLTLPKGLTFSKDAFSKKKVAKLIAITVDGKGKKLKAKCFKRKAANKIEVNFCGKSVAKVKLQFKKGSLIATKKLSKKPTFKMTVTDSDNKPRKVVTVDKTL